MSIFGSNIIYYIVAFCFTLKNVYGYCEMPYPDVPLVVSSVWEQHLPWLETVYGNLTESHTPYSRTSEAVWGSLHPLLPYSIHWSNIVIIIFIHNSPDVDVLIRAHFDTWLKHVEEGVDVFYVTDADDDRSFNEILPNAVSTKANLHIYKSPAEKDGNRLRFKVIDGFRHVGEQKLDDKKYFIKMDSDSYFVPENLLAYLNDLHGRTYPAPVHFGKQNCACGCYTEGAFYAFNDAGFTSINQYFYDHPEISKVELSQLRNGLELFNFMHHEDFLVSYVYRQSTKFPMISNPLVWSHDNERIFYRHYGIAYHKIKQYSRYMEYENHWYFENGTKKAWY